MVFFINHDAHHAIGIKEYGSAGMPVEKFDANKVCAQKVVALGLAEWAHAVQGQARGFGGLSHLAQDAAQVVGFGMVGESFAVQVAGDAVSRADDDIMIGRI